MTFSYSALREIQKKEMESSAIANLDEDFYKKVADLLTLKKKEAMESQTIMSIKEFENIRKTIISIQAKREEKIVLMALRGEIEGKGLTPEEQMFLKRFSETVVEMRTAVKGLWNPSDGGPIAAIRKIRITKSVDQYMGVDKNVYGPFKQGEELMLPKEEAEWLLHAKMAEKID